MMRRRPGYRWRILAHRDKGTESIDQRYTPANRVCFDELVIDDWFHIEQMDYRCWWMRIGDMHVTIRIETNGTRNLFVRWEGGDPDDPDDPKNPRPPMTREWGWSS